MKNIAISILILFSVIACTTTKTNYKGGTKCQQPSINVLPTNTSYIFNRSLNDTLKNKLNNKIDELFEKHQVAGITATVLIPEKGIWQTNRGYISKPNNLIVDSTSVFYWASVGKLITSTIIHQLILEDKLSLNDKLSKWFPQIENSKEISIEQLLTHTNGIYSFNSDSAIHFSNKRLPPNELIAVAKAKKNLFKPGEYWSYTNTGYLLLALITEKIENKTFNLTVKTRIADPLQLKTLKTSNENANNLALAHKKDSVIRKDSYGPLGAGNIESNSKDMAVFLSALLTGKIIPTTNIHNMMKDLYPMFNKGQYYGKGIIVYSFNDLNKTNNCWIGHSGGTENYKAIIAYDTQTKAIVTISINENIPVEAVAYKLMELINRQQ